jgi:hypothetical protein
MVKLYLSELESLQVSDLYCSLLPVLLGLDNLEEMVASERQEKTVVGKP